MKIRQFKRVSGAAAAVAVVLTIAACGGSEEPSTPGTEPGGQGGDAKVSGDVVIDGSSTVEPLSSVAAELFMGLNPDTNVTVGTSGTGGGFKKFCNAETDISDASRPIKDEEKAQCDANTVAYTPLQIANDALTVVVNKENTWIDCMTIDQLKKVWEPDSKINNWNQLDPAFPDEELLLYAPGADSGTFDYFTDAINGEEGASRTDYNPSEDDNIILQGVVAAKGGMGYFGFSYLEAAADKLKAVKIDGGSGCVEPSLDTAQAGTYAPLARPLFIYVSDAGLKKPQVVAFADFYLASNDDIVSAAKFVPMTDEQKAKAKSDLDALKAKAGGQ